MDLRKRESCAPEGPSVAEDNAVDTLISLKGDYALPKDRSGHDPPKEGYPCRFAKKTPANPMPRRIKTVYKQMGRTLHCPLLLWLQDWLATYAKNTPYDRALARASMVRLNLPNMEDCLTHVCLQHELEGMWAERPRQSYIQRRGVSYVATKTYRSGHLCVELRGMSAQTPNLPKHNRPKYLLSFEALLIAIKEGIVRNQSLSVIKRNIQRDWIPTCGIGIELTHRFLMEIKEK